MTDRLRPSINLHVVLRRAVALVFAGAVSLAVVPSSLDAAGLLGVGYNMSWNSSTTLAGADTTVTRTFTEAVDLKYAGLLSPVVANTITMTVNHTRDATGNMFKANPMIELKYKGAYWNMAAKRSIDETDINDPTVKPKIADAYLLDFLIPAPRPTLPDLKGKYDLSMDSQEGETATDTMKHGLNFSSVYKPFEWLDLKGDYSVTRSIDKLKEDGTTQDEKMTGSIGIKHLISERVKVNTEYKVDLSRGGTMLDVGGWDNTSYKEDQGHTWKNTLDIKLFKDTTFGSAYDVDLKQNIVDNTHTLTKTAKASLGQKVGILDMTGDWNWSEGETRHTETDKRTNSIARSLGAKAKFNDLLDFSWKYSNTQGRVKSMEVDDIEPTTTGSSAWSFTWTGTPGPYLLAAFAFDKTDDEVDGVRTALNWKYSYKTTINMKPIGIMIDPSYDVAEKLDYAVDPVFFSTTKDVKVKISWLGIKTLTLDGKIDHTFGRKTDSAANSRLGSINRTDSTTATLAWANPFPNWNWTFGVTRTASDTSGDELPPDVASSFDIKGDYKYEMLSMSTSYKYDLKHKFPGFPGTANTYTINSMIGWVAPSGWNATLTYTFSKTLSAVLTESSSVGLTFSYVL